MYRRTIIGDLDLTNWCRAATWAYWEIKISEGMGVRIRKGGAGRLDCHVCQMRLFLESEQVLEPHQNLSEAGFQRVTWVLPGRAFLVIFPLHHSSWQMIFVKLFTSEHCKVLREVTKSKILYSLKYINTEWRHKK